MMDDRRWKLVQMRLGYNDEEMKSFRANPRNEHVVQKGAELTQIRFVAEVTHSHGCNSRHKVGQKVYFDGYGNLIKELNPERLCIFALSSLSTVIFAAQELVYAGIPPGKLHFNSTGCIDVGLMCGGWGKVVLKLTAENV